MQLKILEANTISEVRYLFRDTLSLCSEAVTYIYSCHSITNDLSMKILISIVDYGEQKNTLNDMCKIIKCFIEINQEALSECKEEWRHRELRPFVYGYYCICQGTYKLYCDFLRLLNDAADHWLSVKLALGQMVTKIKAEVYSYREILPLLNGLEGAEGIRFSDHFIKSFACICGQIVDFPRHLDKEIQNVKRFKSVALMKASSITIGGVFSLVAAYMGNDKLLQGMKAASSCFEWLQMIQSFVIGSRSYGRELRILELFDCAVVVKELNSKLARFGSFTPQFEEEMLIVNDKLEEKINNFSKGIEDMCRHAHIYSLDIRNAGLCLSRFIADTNLQAPSYRKPIMFSKQVYECPLCNKTISILYKATLSVHIDLLWYIHAYEAAADSSLPLSYDSVILDNTNSVIKIICGRYKRSLDDIHEVTESLNAINQEAFMVLSECKEEWRVPKLFPLVNDNHKICLRASELYIDFVRLIKGHFEWLSTPLLLLKKNIKVNSPNKQDKGVCYIDNGGVLMFSHDFIQAMGNICNQTLAFTRQLDEEIQELKSVKILVKVSSELIAGVFSVMANCIPDEMPFMGTPETLNDVWLCLNQILSLKSFSWRVLRFAIKDFSDFTSWEIRESGAVLEEMNKL